MELLTASYCPYCKSWIDIESMLTLENLKERHFYLTCSKCNKTFMTHSKTEITVKVNSIEDAIAETKKDLFFHKEMIKIYGTKYPNTIIRIRKHLIKELEAIKKRNDKGDD